MSTSSWKAKSASPGRFRLVGVSASPPSAGAALGTLAALDGGPRGAGVFARGRVRCAVLRDAFQELTDGRTAVAIGFQHAVVQGLVRDVRATIGGWWSLPASGPVALVAGPDGPSLQVV